jgi:hypothetical protein
MVFSGACPEAPRWATINTLLFSWQTTATARYFYDFAQHELLHDFPKASSYAITHSADIDGHSFNMQLESKHR